MRRFVMLATVGALAALAVAAPGSAKGPSAASLSGPGLDHALPIKGEGESGTGTPLGSLVQAGGFFPQMFVEVPDSTTRSRPVCIPIRTRIGVLVGQASPSSWRCAVTAACSASPARPNAAPIPSPAVAKTDPSALEIADRMLSSWRS